MKIHRVTLLIAGLFLSFSIQSQKLCIEISNIQNCKGNLILAFFNSNAAFKNEESLFDKTYSKSEVKNGKMTVELTLKPGIYGISVLDDEDKNGRMKYNLIRIPKEGFGFSNYVHKGLWRPIFEDFNFILKEKNLHVEVKMRYL